MPEVGVLERDAAGVVLLDEYQDTSVAQRRMLAGLFGGGHPVTAVGDPCQAIYGWRGASVANLDGFPTHFPLTAGDPARTFSLSVNQRSGGRLLQLANTVAAALRDKHAVVELSAPPAKAALGRVVTGLHESWAQEVEWVAGQVVAASETTPWKQIAVLVRARRDFGDLHAALVTRGIPVEVVGLGGLLALPEVADVVAILEVIDEPTANAALLRLLTGPRWRLGVRDLAQLGRRGKELLVSGPKTDRGRRPTSTWPPCSWRMGRSRTPSPASTRATSSRCPTSSTGLGTAAGRSRGSSASPPSARSSGCCAATATSRCSTWSTGSSRCPAWTSSCPPRPRLSTPGAGRPCRRSSTWWPASTTSTARAR